MKALIIALAIGSAVTGSPGLAAAATTATVADLGWMAGTWVQERNGVTTREVWLSPMGGAMAGLTQTNRAGRPVQIEYASITTSDKGPVFTAIVGGQGPTAFILKPGSTDTLVFENPQHDFPQRVIYRRCEADLCARIEGAMDGKPASMDWRYRRQP